MVTQDLQASKAGLVTRDNLVNQEALEHLEKGVGMENPDVWAVKE